MHRFCRAALAAGLVAALPGTALAQVVKVDPSIPTYAKVAGISGNLNSVGSDTLNNLILKSPQSWRGRRPLEPALPARSHLSNLLVRAETSVGLPFFQITGTVIEWDEIRFDVRLMCASGRSTRCA